MPAAPFEISKAYAKTRDPVAKEEERQKIQKDQGGTSVGDLETQDGKAVNRALSAAAETRLVGEVI